MKEREQTNILAIAIVVIVLVGGTLAIIWVARPNTQSQSVAPNSEVSSSEDANIFDVSEAVFDFGTISMAAGEVSRAFQIKNAGSENLLVEGIYTSCMCTNAVLKKGDKEFGPFGMPGHGSLARISQEFIPGEQAELVVTFDPAAHGPSGVGYIERMVYIETPKGKQELMIKARVTP